MHDTAQERRAIGQRVGLLLMHSETDSFEGLDAHREDLGATMDEAAARLFAALRALDTRCDVILAHTLPGEGLGAAVRDRLVRAAEGRLIPTP
jgi:L-threonylcarbamoyladenylate synthase